MAVPHTFIEDPSMGVMVYRSFLFTPGDEPRMMRKALETEADAVIYDLEDAIAPSAKGTARSTVTQLLSTLDGDHPDIVVRINPLTTYGREDVTALVTETDRLPDRITFPMVEGAEQVGELVSILDEYGVHIDISATIETAKGLLAAPEIAQADGVVSLGFGAEDLSADLGATRTPKGDELLYAQQRIVVAAAAADVYASHTVYTDIDDLEGLASVTRAALTMGFDGKSAIHPKQVPVINDVFTPDEEELDWARRVIEAEAEATENDKGVFTVDGEMIDPPVVERARTIMDRAEAAGLR